MVDTISIKGTGKITLLNKTRDGTQSPTFQISSEYLNLFHSVGRLYSLFTRMEMLPCKVVSWIACNVASMRSDIGACRRDGQACRDNIIPLCY